MNFIDLAAQRDRIRPQIDAAIATVATASGTTSVMRRDLVPTH